MKVKPKRVLGMGKTSWIIIGSWALMLLGIGQYLTERPRGPTASERRLARIQEEAVVLGSSHPWAGNYYRSEVSMHVAPRSGYARIMSYCIGPDDYEVGSVHEKDGAIILTQSWPTGRSELFPVRWGARRYLLDKDELISFANYVNGGTEPRADLRGSFFLRDGDQNISVKGLPDLPEPGRSLLLANPLSARVIHAGGYRPAGTEFGNRQRNREIILGIGRRSGARARMEFVKLGVGRATIERVGENSSFAMLREDGKTGEVQKGQMFSTRWYSSK
ncbi:MAG: hypothetical protein HY923_07245 [Elusimicrobia bacterium]|nr:hypothetical protein [Elusimicrobiota bacterium]